MEALVKQICNFRECGSGTFVIPEVFFTFQQFCDAFFQDIQVGKLMDYNVLIITSTITAVFHVLYLLMFFFPAIYLLLKRKDKILNLFESVPKETVGQIYHELKKKIGNHTAKEGTSFSPSTMVVL